MSTSTPPPRGFAGHLVACAVGASLDNVFRTAINVTLAGIAIAQLGAGAQAEHQAQSYVLWTMLLFNLPFILCAPTAGTLGDRLPKHQLIRAARIADLACVLIGGLGLWLREVPLLLAAMGLFATVSAFFAPVKLAVVPELVAHDRLAKANGWLAGITVLAILIGTALAAVGDHALLTKLTGATPGAVHALSVGLVTGCGVLLCIAGIAGAWSIPRLTAQRPNARIAMPWSLVRQFSVLNERAPDGRGLWAPALGLAGFWSLGALAATGIPLIAKFIYGYDELGAAPLMITLALGLITGSLLAHRFMHAAFPAGLPVMGALLAGAALAAAGWHAQHGGAVSGFGFWLFLSGVGAGLWEVPLTVLLQERAPAERRNLVMSATTILASLGSVGITVLTMALADGWFSERWSTTGIFIGVGVFAALLAVVFAVLFAQQMTCWLVAMVVRTLWRLSATGGQHLPATGGCLIVCNHLSYADGVALCARLDRPVRFLVYRSFFKMPVVGWILHAIGAIPVAAEDGRSALLASLDAAVEALKRGEVVAIFPEGKLTRSGAMDRFKSGLERIASRANVPVLPVFLDGLYGTWMSRAVAKEWFRPLRRVAVQVGAPLPPSVTAAEARRAVAALGFEVASAHAANDQRTVAMAAIGLMRQHPTAVCVRDAQGTLVNWQALGVAHALGSHLTLAATERRVGVVLPPGRPGTLVNLALAMRGITAVNLNHTAGQAAVARMCEMAGISTIISATPYLKRIGNPELPGRVLHIETLLPQISKAGIVWHALQCLALPARWTCRGRADDVATIVFSSGSTGDPKGVQLTHRQVLANCRAVRQGLDLQPYTDVILSPLPLFHSFGLIPGMWLGLTHGLSIAAHPDPTDGKTIGELAQSLKATFMLSTPTFVRGWMRRIEPEQFKTLRLAVVGAERCPPELKTAFKERYGVDLLEGYGCTELCPTVAVNLPEVRRDREVEIHSRDGSVGRALPGLDAFTVDLQSGERLPPDSDGLIVVRSPSRMLGYLDRPDLTEKAFVHGGYNTGDIGRVDADGFIRITGRLARFAKIAGEMIPLDNVEALLSAGLQAQNDTAELAVAAVADEARGERLVVLHTPFTGDWAAIFSTLDGQPALWKPKPKDLAEVADIPKLGTGKRDLAALKRLAQERFAKPAG